MTLKGTQWAVWLGILFTALGVVVGAALDPDPASATAFTAGCADGFGDAAALISSIAAANDSSPGPDTVALTGGCTYVLTAPNNYWYGPNGLPPIASDITIEGNGATIARLGQVPFRIFFVAADPATQYVTPSLQGGGKLTLRAVTLSNGLAKGGDARFGGGGGAGMGGAIFNQGTLVIERSTLSANTAQGGSAKGSAAGFGGGGGIGADASENGGGGFGPSFNATGLGAGAGAVGNGGGGGGAGFRVGQSGSVSTPSTPGAGGGPMEGTGGTGGPGFSTAGGAAGDGSGGGGGVGASQGGAGGAFGSGGQTGTETGAAGGGAGVGGGGGPGRSGFSAQNVAGLGGAGGGGGFGGGGGGGGVGGISTSSPGFGANGGGGGSGGFGGGGGAGGSGGDPPGATSVGAPGSPGGAGFGGGSPTVDRGGGGAGMGGGIFNMQGQVVVLDSTRAGNVAIGGTDEVSDHGKGIGGAVFNLSGGFAADDSTLANNSADYDGASIYNLVYDDHEVRTAQVILRDTIVSGGAGPFELASNKSTYIGPGPQPAASAASIDVSQFDLVRSMHTVETGTIAGVARTADPLLGPLAANGGPTKTMALGAASPALDAGSSFGLATDQRGIARPFDLSAFPNLGDGSDIGAFELVPAKPAADTTPPSFTGPVRADPARFAVDPKGKPETAITSAKSRKHAAKKGTTIRYALSEDARVSFTIERQAKGRRAGSACAKPTKANRRHKACTRYLGVGAFAQQAKAGGDAKPFSGRIGSKHLAPGHYRGTLLATDAAGNRSKTAQFAFTVVKR